MLKWGNIVAKGSGQPLKSVTGAIAHLQAATEL